MQYSVSRGFDSEQDFLALRSLNQPFILFPQLMPYNIGRPGVSKTCGHLLSFLVSQWAIIGRYKALCNTTVRPFPLRLDFISSVEFYCFRQSAQLSLPRY